LDWKLFGDIAFYGTATSAAVFALLYLVFAPWWKTETGRNIMAVMGSIAIAFVYFAWVIAQGGVPGSFYPARALIFTGIGLSITWRLVRFVKIQLPLLREPKEGNENEFQDTR
jgi:hypothetical protein